MMRIGFAFFNPVHEIVMHHAMELGVHDAVTNGRWAGFNSYSGEWDYMPLLRTKLAMNEFGMNFSVLEGVGCIDSAKLGKKDRDEAIARFIKLLENCSKLGIRTVCYNWMPVWEWFRTGNQVKLPGGATVTDFDRSLVPEEPISSEGIVTADELWSNLEYFLKKVVPYAEKYRVQLAVHPDDPPVNRIGGVDRILTSADAMQRVIDIAPSDFNGITMCQACFAAMGENVPEVIHKFGEQGKIFFAHFRDISGNLDHFNEEFQDTGKTDMVAAMRAYYDVGFEGVIRPDHVPTMYMDHVNEQGYGINGNLYATGFMRGLMRVIESEKAGDR